MRYTRLTGLSHPSYPYHQTTHQGQHWVHQAPAEAARGEAVQCRRYGNSIPAKAAVGWVLQPAGPAGCGGEHVEEASTWGKH